MKQQTNFTKDDILQAALIYRESGLSVLPTGRDKAPRLKEWTPRKHEIPSEETVRENFSKNEVSVAILGGKVSGNAEYIDFDFKSEFFDPWCELVKKDDPDLISRLVRQGTQSDGDHIGYRCPGITIPGNQKLARKYIEVPHDGNHSYKGKEFKARKIGDKYFIDPAFIETRGEGGYILAFPSPGYQIKNGKFSQLPIITPEERDILIEAAKALGDCPPLEPQIRISNKINFFDGFSPGDDFNERGDVESLLIKHGWINTGRQSSNGEGEHWRRPGKDKGQSATLYNKKVFHNFSGNGSPFESEQTYSPFGIYTLLEHGGDFSEAAKELSRQGYGSNGGYNELLEERLAIMEEGKAPEGKSDVLEFPKEVISGIAGNYAQLMTEYFEAPIQFPYFSFLTCLGAVLSDRLTIRTVLKPQTRLYVLLLGPSGESRKSTTINNIINLFQLALTHDSGINMCWGAGSEIGLMKRLEKYKSLLLCFDEFKQLTGKSSIQGSNLLPCIATLFDKNIYENQTKKESIFLKDAHLSLLAASTPETYESTWSPEFTNIGFNNRLFIVPGEGKKGRAIPPEIPESQMSPIKIGISKILSTTKENPVLDLTRDAYELYSRWYDNRENSVHSRRLDTYALRLMCLLAVNELKTEVGVDVAQKAIKLCDWQLWARKFYTPIDADNKVAHMEEKIRRTLGRHGALTEREMFNQTNAKREGRWVFETALKNLVNGKEVVRKKDGRAIRFFLVQSDEV